MRSPPALALLALLAAPATGCGPGTPADVCGLSGVMPDVEEVGDGRGRALLGGEAWEANGTWSPGSNASVNLGLLELTVPRDETGTDTSDLIARRAFPICITLGERSNTSGSATFEGRFLTTAAHGGSAAVLGEQGGFLLGRFELELKDNNGVATVVFEGGAFRVPRFR
jgi:hypothetical protein